MSWKGRRWRRSKGGWRGWCICSGQSRWIFSLRCIYLPPTSFYERANECILQLLQIARRHFDDGGERMRFTFPALITSAIKLCRRYKNREHLVSTVFSTSASSILNDPLLIGTRLAKQRLQYPQIRAPTHLHSLYPNRGTNDRATSLPSFRTDRR